LLPVGKVKKILIQDFAWCKVAPADLCLKKEGVRKKMEKSTFATLDLRGKQSVRATFKLSTRAIDSLSLVAVHLGIKQKSLFDHLIEDAEALGDLAATIRLRQFQKIDRVQKTYVLSRRTLEVLEEISKSHDTPRDALVEYSLKRLESVITTEKKQHEQRKQLFDRMAANWDAGLKILDEAKETLGDADPFCINVERAMAACLKTKEELSVYMEKSRSIEEY
jgi:hypothetical protein